MTLRKAFYSALVILWTTTSGGGFLSARAMPQDAQPTSSVADAARKSREQKKDTSKSAKVYTDDDISSLKGVVSVVGIAPAPPAKPGDAAAAPAPKAAAGEVKDEAYWRQKYADARRALADDSKELDVLQREFNLKEQQYYSNPNVALAEQYSRKDLDDTQQQIDAKKQAVDKDNQAISDLDDALRQAGGDPSWAREQ